MKLLVAVAVALPSAVSAFTGRCHVYGGLQAATACGYVTTKEETDPAHPNFERCGLTPKTACLSTMDGITWGEARCGNCYKVTIHMKDDADAAHCTTGVCKGYERSVYIKTLDGSYSDAEFEMSQIAWDTLCPNLCHSNPHENCVMDYNECKYGTYDDNKYYHADGETFTYPASCAASSHPVTYEQVDCNSDERIVQPDPVVPGGPTTTSGPTTKPAATTTTAPAAAPTTTTKGSVAPPPSGGAGCYASTQWWDADCKSSNHCILFSEYKNEALCIQGNEPNAVWAADAADCLAKLTPHACDTNTK